MILLLSPWFRHGCLAVEVIVQVWVLAGVSSMSRVSTNLCTDYTCIHVPNSYIYKMMWTSLYFIYNHCLCKLFFIIHFIAIFWVGRGYFLILSNTSKWSYRLRVSAIPFIYGKWLPVSSDLFPSNTEVTEVNVPPNDSRWWKCGHIHLISK